MAKVLPLTAAVSHHCPGLKYHPNHVRKLPVTRGYAVVLHQLQLTIHNLAAIWQKK